MDHLGTPSAAGPSMIKPPTTQSVPKKKIAPRPSVAKPKKGDGLIAHTSAFVPFSVNIKIPAGDYLCKEVNIDVARQASLAKAKHEREAATAETERLVAEGQTVTDVNPLSNILIIHPGSRNLRIGRASDFYPKEIPNCIARPGSAANRGRDPPVPSVGSKRALPTDVDGRGKRRKVETGDVDMDDDAEEVSEVDTNIGHLRSYLKEKLRINKLNTDWKETTRVINSNIKSRPENIPEHNDPYRVDWAEMQGKQYLVGAEALRIPTSSNFKVRWPILQRGFNERDWTSRRLLLDDIALIIQDSIRTELDIPLRDYSKYSVVLIVPDNGDRSYVQEMTHMILSVMGFKETAVHQEGYAAIFSAGLSSACVVDMGAQQTSVVCVDEGQVLSESRVNLAYGGDDITAALTAMLQRSSFPFKDLDLAKNQDWLMMDNLKIRICTLAEHLVANIPWDFYVVREKGLTQKYMFRTYDENILAPLIFFDTRLIDFGSKRRLAPASRQETDNVDDMLISQYGAPSAAMRISTDPLIPVAPQPMRAIVPNPIDGDILELAGDSQEQTPIPIETARIPSASQPSDNGDAKSLRDETTPALASRASTPLPRSAPIPSLSELELLIQSSHVPLDTAISASIACLGKLGTENKAKNAASSILLIGGGSALNGLGAFLTERLPPLLRARDMPINDVSIIPPPRNLNPRFSSWKGASVMCNLESMSDMWIRRDEWDALGARALKDRYAFF